MLGARWLPLSLPATKLRIDLSLTCGQCFTWYSSGEKQWTKVIDKQLITLKQTDDDVLLYVAEDCNKENAMCIVRDYFQLDVNLEELYGTWSKADQHFEKFSSTFQGLRILRQDPVENVFSFICASCNNIERITQMVEKMSKRFGTHVASFENRDFYSFPTVEELANNDTETILRELGFGYRAKYIHQAAKMVVQNGGASWLHGLRKLSYADTVSALITLPGIGRKVADCISLFSMDKPEAVPVDTHVWQIAARDYALDIQNKSLTDRVYISIGDLFRKLHGPYAGWANSVLFAADLKRFEELRGSSPIKVKRRKSNSNASSPPTTALKRQQPNQDESTMALKPKRKRNGS